MPYFFILPAFVLYVVAMSVALVVTCLYRPANRRRRVLLYVLIWSSAGFVAFTIAHAALVAATLLVSKRIFRDELPVPAGILVGAMIFIGPFLAAVIGLASGVWIGIRRRRGTSRRPA